MDQALTDALKVLLSLFLLVATAGAAWLVAYLKARTRALDLTHAEDMTRIAVAATNQTMAHAPAEKKLDNTVALLGKLADPVLIEAEVQNVRKDRSQDCTK
jgi:hypothetical protein